MRNQPKYNFFKNTSYALNGLKDIITTEKSFKIELFFAVLLVPFICFISIDLLEKILLLITLFGVLIAESINSAIERVVDLVTKEYHPMAGRAKDVGSSIVFLSISLAVITWGIILYKNFNSIF
ncbi:MAG TPA: diacylglycerol kinase [Sulfurospirillum sp. UBA11407]|nr:MAG TPA: diacylglycerol kinase [Sulfurospirillum sp. UBA11407]